MTLSAYQLAQKIMCHDRSEFRRLYLKMSQRSVSAYPYTLDLSFQSWKRQVFWHIQKSIHCWNLFSSVMQLSLYDLLLMKRGIRREMSAIMFWSRRQALSVPPRWRDIERRWDTRLACHVAWSSKLFVQKMSVWNVKDGGSGIKDLVSSLDYILALYSQ